MIQVFVDDRDAQRKLARIQGRFATMRGGLDRRSVDELEAKFVTFARRQFQTNGGAGGEKWAELRPSTLAQKAAKGTLSRGILRDTMEMYHMLTDQRSDMRRWERAPNGAKVSFLLEYFKAHQTGTKRMEARPVYPDPLPESFIEQIKNTIRGFLLEGEFA